MIFILKILVEHDGMAASVCNSGSSINSFILITYYNDCNLFNIKKYIFHPTFYKYNSNLNLTLN